MAVTEASIALGFNQAELSLTPFRDFLGFEPRMSKVPLGARFSRALSGKSAYDGEVLTTINISAQYHEYIDNYVTAIFGGWYNNQSVEVTLGILAQDNNYYRYNAIADVPEIGSDYSFRYTDELENIILRFYIEGLAT